MLAGKYLCGRKIISGELQQMQRSQHCKCPNNANQGRAKGKAKTTAEAKAKAHLKRFGEKPKTYRKTNIVGPEA